MLKIALCYDFHRVCDLAQQICPFIVFPLLGRTSVHFILSQSAEKRFISIHSYVMCNFSSFIILSYLSYHINSCFYIENITVISSSERFFHCRGCRFCSMCSMCLFAVHELTVNPTWSGSIRCRNRANNKIVNSAIRSAIGGP